MKETLVQNPPNAAKLVESLRQLDYTNITAVADIVDNSIDANASQIWITILPSTGKASSEVGTVIISDNGTGMSGSVLDEALKLGSEAGKNPTCDLGLYGMGLVTSSISLGTRLEVVTKTAEGPCWQSVQDLEIIYEHRKFVKLLAEAGPEARKLFQTYVLDLQQKFPLEDQRGSKPKRVDAGTVVVISGIDNSQWKTIRGLADNLSASFGRIYRKFLTAGTNRIYVQGNEISPVDPIFDFEPSILCQDTIKLDDGSLEILIAEVKDYGLGINREKGINIANQGFYVLRNNREILSGQSLGILTKHNDLNTLRIELSYPGTLDRIMSSNFSKNKIALNQSVADKVAKICNPFIRATRKRSKHAQQAAADSSQQDLFSEAEKYITQKAHLLKRPPVQIEQGETKTLGTGTPRREPGGNGSAQKGATKKRVSLDSLKVKFAQRASGEKGPVYDVDQERDVVMIYWNTDHPFYNLFIRGNSNDPDVLNPICFLVYSLGNAELISTPDSDSQQLLENMRWDVGRNLAVLLRD